MSPLVRGALVVAIITVILGVAWNRYYAFLSRGQAIPESTRILDQIEKQGVPDFTLKDINGKDVSLKDFRGKLVILSFWASWCEPCIQEFPSMLKLVDAMKGEVQLVGVSADYEEKDISAFLQAFKIKSSDIHIMWDKDQVVAKKYGTFKLPESYIINKDGSLVRKISGVENWSSPDALVYFKELAATSGEVKK